ncbi:MAG: endo alpha-1,4 polygalactosaminidase [Alphaproteobacteria bacterium]|nr:endo alpha-1,4 polygalactosaminidase [Alphaproteobacteria bacterium]
MHPLPALAALALVACGGPDECPAGEVRDAGTCIPYTPGDPVEAEVWQPEPGATWQWQLTGAIDTTLAVGMYDVDLYEATDADLAALGDKVVICYFSAGSLEDFRDDVAFVSDDAIGRTLDGWPDERWLDVTHPDTFELARRRLDRAVERGCDGVEPDNVDGYANASGFPLTSDEQLRFNRFLADEAHERGLSVGLKNDLDQLDALQPWFDWALNEECVAFDECDLYGDWITEKAVFHTEYANREDALPELAASVCPERPAAFSTLLKTWDLGPEFVTCE